MEDIQHVHVSAPQLSNVKFLQVSEIFYNAK